MLEIPSLPYKYSDLEPYIDEATMRVHHLGHHQAYADKLNAALEKYPDVREKPVEELIRQAEKLVPEDIRAAVVNSGGGYLNHNFWWETLHRPIDADNKPDGTMLGALIEEQFGDLGNFKGKFKEKAMSLFGSGWTWLVAGEGDKLEIVNTANQNLSPEGKRALFSLDLWEHAYYLKYQNKRNDYIDAFFHVLDWRRADSRLKQAS